MNWRLVRTIGAVVAIPVIATFVVTGWFWIPGCVQFQERGRIVEWVEHHRGDLDRVVSAIPWSDGQFTFLREDPNAPAEFSLFWGAGATGAHGFRSDGQDFIYVEFAQVRLNGQRDAQGVLSWVVRVRGSGWN